MAAQKEEIIANLYGLRAGLSVISQEHDKIQAAEDKANIDFGCLNYRENEIKRRTATINEQSTQFDSDISKNKYYLIVSIIQLLVFVPITLICTIKFFGFKNSYNVTSTMPFICGAVFGFALFCIFLGLQFLYMRDGSIIEFSFDSSECFLVLFFALLFLGGIGCGIATIVLFIAYAADKGVVFCGLAFAGIVLGVLVIFISIIQIKIHSSNYKLYVGKRNSQAAEFEVELNKMQTETNNMPSRRAQIADERVRIITPHVFKVKDTYAVLRKGFCSILDERDWQNVDLVIYYLEMRRADTIKEALQLVDRELQTQRIENLICSATQSIVNTLEAGFSAMQQSLAIVYNGLSQQLSGISSQLSNVSSTIVNSQVMNQALIAKMNVTSNQMVKELKEIKNNAEYMRLKLS